MILAANIFKKSLLFVLFFLGACSNNNEILSISGETFGTFYDIKFEKSQYNVKNINDEINNVFISINQCCSTYKSDSLVSFKRDSKNTDLFNEEVKYYFQEVLQIVNYVIFVFIPDCTFFQSIVGLIDALQPSSLSQSSVSSSVRRISLLKFEINHSHCILFQF